MSYEIGSLLDLLHSLRKLQHSFRGIRQWEIARALEPAIQLLENEIELKVLEYTNDCEKR